ncbi:MAG: regulatory iron-sulfur-containing complex subunit RicT [bacterium]|nr:regulatory iron-sulfur-containing complex subunit RicT [bacterium]MDD7236649.1 regulatory iron-sulfur-containing complex subunit RicT [bacterium]MDY2650185.1 regulatory iron-sulfur-containing complex subunit RicT [Candidatus Egerieousia sp.]MDY5256149.1 regulatory iron-sulfur-containing complex subunit RicT [Candidatus Egerieousia sp.]
MGTKDKITYDCLRGCKIITTPEGERDIQYDYRSCKLSVFNWLSQVYQDEYNSLFEVRFKNTHKCVYKNSTGQRIKAKDIVVVEAQNGYDVGIVTLSGPNVAMQLKRDRIDYRNYEFRQIYRKARPADIERWQEAIAREHSVMIRAREIAASLNLNMKIGDVEFQGDGTKAIFYYIADERVDFRQLIKVFAEEFRIRIEMRQIGARQEAGLIGGIGVCGQELCCARYMNDFQSITTQAARCQELSLNPQKLAGQCGKLKCCINYEAPAYMDAQQRMPRVTEPLQLEDGEAFLMKTDILGRKMWFSYDKSNFSNLYSLSSREVREIIHLNREGKKGRSLMAEQQVNAAEPEFKSAVGEESITRFDKTGKRSNRPHRNHRHSGKEKRD